MFNRGLSSSGGWTNRLEGTHAMASLGAQMVKNPPVMRETWVQFLDSEDPLEKIRSFKIQLPPNLPFSLLPTQSVSLVAGETLEAQALL